MAVLSNHPERALAGWLALPFAALPAGTETSQSHNLGFFTESGSWSRARATTTRAPFPGRQPGPPVAGVRQAPGLGQRLAPARVPQPDSPDELPLPPLPGGRDQQWGVAGVPLDEGQGQHRPVMSAQGAGHVRFAGVEDE